MAAFFLRKKKEVTETVEEPQKTVEAAKKEAETVNTEPPATIVCPACGREINKKTAEKNKYVCYECGNYFRVRTKNRIRMVADKDTFEPWFEELESKNPLDFPGYLEKIKAAQALFNDTFINGDTGKDAKAFDGLDKIISSRIDKKSIGFNAEIADKRDETIGDLFRQVLPEDFVKFGLIPEFIGRVPVNVSLNPLDEEALVRILKEPKSALVKQYQRLFEMDGVKLMFDDDALVAIAKKALERKTGARGLRAIMEGVIMDLMYEIPSQTDVSECLITKDVVEGKEKPMIEHSGVKVKAAVPKKRVKTSNHGEIA